MKKALLLCASLSLLTAAATPVLAQTKPAAKPAAAAPASGQAAQTITPPTFGAATPGQCVFNEEVAMTSSQMGQAAGDRLMQLRAVVEAELEPEAEALKTEYETLAASEKTTPAAQRSQWEQKAGAWEQKRAGYDRKAQIRSQELQVTQQQVMSAIFQSMIPHINAAVTAKGCSTVVSASALFHYEVSGEQNGQPVQSTFVYANPAMDITKDVVTRMDGSGQKLPQFNRVNLEQRANAAAAK